MKGDWISDVLSGERDNKSVELKGWVHRTRGNKNIRFIVLRDSTGSVQCVVKRDIVGDELFENVASALIESSMIIEGEAVSYTHLRAHET